MMDDDNSELENIRSIAQKRFWHEGEILTARTEFFLIGQGILLEAFISATHLPMRGVEIAVFGLVSSLAWFMIGARNDWHIKYITAVVETPEVAGSKLAADFAKAIMAVRKNQPKWLRWAHSVSLFGRVIPFTCFDTWVALSLQQWLPVWLVATTTIFLALGAIWLFRKWPRTDVDADVRVLLQSVGLRKVGAV